MGDLSYRTEEKIESPQEIRERKREERAEQSEYDFGQGRRKGLGLPQPKVLKGVYKTVKARAEEEREEREKQSRHDYAAGARFDPHRAGWM